MKITQIVNEGVTPNMDDHYVEYISDITNGRDYAKALAHAWEKTFGQAKGISFESWADELIDNATQLSDNEKSEASNILPSLRSRWHSH